MSTVIHTKSNTDTGPTGFEEASALGRIYNAFSGREVKVLMLHKLENLLDQHSVPSDLAAEVLTRAGMTLNQHPDFDSEVLGFPRADIGIGFVLRPVQTSTNTHIQFFFKVTRHPREENRVMNGIVERLSQIPWAFESEIRASLEWNMDQIPPDAQRILHDMPVPTPTRVVGSGADGSALIIDKETPATQERKTAVERQFKPQDLLKGGKK